jgi:hypothetical protein
MDPLNLPELPPYIYGRECGPNERVYSPDQLRAYATAAVLAERERCAKVAERKAEDIRRVNTYRGKVNQISGFAADMVEDLASAIRGSYPASQGEGE